MLSVSRMVLGVGVGLGVKVLVGLGVAVDVGVTDGTGVSVGAGWVKVTDGEPGSGATVSRPDTTTGAVGAWAIWPAGLVQPVRAHSAIKKAAIPARIATAAR